MDHHFISRACPCCLLMIDQPAATLWFTPSLSDDGGPGHQGGAPLGTPARDRDRGLRHHLIGSIRRAYDEPVVTVDP
jgi:hypothetical protein